MEINAAKAVETAISYGTAKNNDSNSVVSKANVDNEKVKIQVVDGDKDKDISKDISKDKDKDISKDDMVKMNDALNNFMTAINSDLHFVMHDKAKELMLQVVDRRNNKVLKEIPSREMLDVIANIRESVGALLDKRA